MMFSADHPGDLMARPKKMKEGAELDKTIRDKLAQLDWTI